MPRGDGIRIHNQRIVAEGSAAFVELVRRFAEEHLKSGAANRFPVAELAQEIGHEPRVVGVFLSSGSVLEALGLAMPGYVWSYERRSGVRPAALVATPREIQEHAREAEPVAASAAGEPSSWFKWPWE